MQYCSVMFLRMSHKDVLISFECLQLKTITADQGNAGNICSLYHSVPIILYVISYNRDYHWSNLHSFTIYFHVTISSNVCYSQRNNDYYLYHKCSDLE